MSILTLDNPQFDEINVDYYDDIIALARRALAEDISQAEYSRQQWQMTMAALLTLFLVTGADADTPAAQQFLAEQRDIASEAAAALAEAVFASRYAESDEQSAVRGWEKLTERLELWTYSAGRAYQRGIISALPADGREKIFAWDLGRTEKHCTTCLEMSGQELTQSQWLVLAADGIEPQGHGLACGGFRCDCRRREVR